MSLDQRQLARIDEHLQRAYLEPRKIDSCQVLVAHRGEVAHRSSHGCADDTIWRLFSMTKPVTGVALLTLYEQGYLQLSDPVHRFIPSWRDVRVREGDQLVAPHRPPSVRDVLMHMSGIGYGAGNADLNIEGGLPEVPWKDLEELADGIVEAPLRFQPGTRWLYSFGMDVAARIVEVISGMPYDEYLKATIFESLGMVDTDFWVPEDKRDRLAPLHARNRRKELVELQGRSYSRRPTLFNGGGGLVGTLDDYFRFAQMLANGGTLDGTRVLGRKTVELMGTNHLPGSGELREFAIPGGYGEVGFDGMGFGLTVAVTLDQARTQVIGSPGEIMWGGAASTIFWVDPVEDLVVVFMTQLLPSGTFNFRGQLKSIVYPALP